MSMSEVLKMNAKSLSVKGLLESEYILCHCTSQNLWTLLFTEKSFSQNICQYMLIMWHMCQFYEVMLMLPSRKMKHHFTFIWSCKNIRMTLYHSSEWDIVLKKMMLGTSYDICQDMLIMGHMSQLLQFIRAKCKSNSSVRH